MAVKKEQVAKEEVVETVEAPEPTGYQEEFAPEDVLFEEDSSMVDEMGNVLAFPNGPTEDQVAEWRSRFKEIYLTEFEDGELLVWRTLNRKEYKDVMKIPNADNYYKEERICSAVMLWPLNYGFQNITMGKAGIPTLIFELVMEKSGFTAKTGAYRL